MDIKVFFYKLTVFIMYCIHCLFAVLRIHLILMRMWILVMNISLDLRIFIQKKNSKFIFLRKFL